MRCNADHTQSTKVKRQLTKSEMVPRPFGSLTKPTKFGGEGFGKFFVLAVTVEEVTGTANDGCSRNCKQMKKYTTDMNQTSKRNPDRKNLLVLKHNYNKRKLY